MSEITEIGRCIDGTCEDYDLCEVVFDSPEDGFNDRIICEGFKFSGKVNAERKKNSACYEGYGWKLSNVEWEWELTAPCDSPFFDKRFKSQFCDKYGLSITGYVLKGCGTDDWVAKETLTACIITEFGREYGEGVNRTIKGVALHHKILDGSGVNNKNIATTSINQSGATYTLGDSIMNILSGVSGVVSTYNLANYAIETATSGGSSGGGGGGAF